MRFVRNSTGLMILLATMLFAVGYAIVILLINQQNEVVQGTGFGFTNMDSLAEFEPPEDTVSLSALLISMKLTPPAGAGDDGSIVTIGLDDYGFYISDTSDGIDADTLCVDQLVVSQSTPAQGVGNILVGVNLFEDLEPLCSDLGTMIPIPDIGTIYLKPSTRSALTQETYDRIYTQFPSTNVFNRYPYDGFNFNGALQVSYRLLSGEEVVASGTVKPVVVWLFDTSSERNWNIEVETSDGVRGETPVLEDGTTFDVYNSLLPGEYQQVDMRFERPLLFRITYPFLIIAMLVLIGMLPFIEQLDAVLEITAGVLFGIYGLNQFMMPPDSQGQTILDVIFLGLYSVLAFTLLLIIFTRAVKSYRNRREAELSNQD